LEKIRYCCLVMSEGYVRSHFADILDYANTVEKRLEDDCTLELVLEDNAKALRMCRKYGCETIWIDESYGAAINGAIENL